MKANDRIKQGGWLQIIPKAIQKVILNHGSCLGAKILEEWYLVAHYDEDRAPL